MPPVTRSQTHPAKRAKVCLNPKHSSHVDGSKRNSRSEKGSTSLVATLVALACEKQYFETCKCANWDPELLFTIYNMWKAGAITTEDVRLFSKRIPEKLEVSRSSFRFLSSSLLGCTRILRWNQILILQKSSRNFRDSPRCVEAWYLLISLVRDPLRDITFTACHTTFGLTLHHLKHITTYRQQPTMDSYRGSKSSETGTVVYPSNKYIYQTNKPVMRLYKLGDVFRLLIQEHGSWALLMQHLSSIDKKLSASTVDQMPVP